MLAIKAHRRFEKDAKLAAKRGKNMDRLWTLIEQLQTGKVLAPRHRPHRLTGNWSPFMECHIEPDWLLIYLTTDSELELLRTGTHADLFE